MNRNVRPLIQLLLTGTALTSPFSVGAGELPHGASTVYGGVSISTPSANQLTIQQTTSSAIVNWQGFSIGSGARVDISQPSASSAILNRVTGSTPSTIAGQLNANGQVYLVNPNGIAITKTGTVNAGAFVASTLDTTDQEFKAGKRVFRGTGQSATVSNQGSITVQQGGYAALLGGRVENSGLISVPMGKVGLGAGEQATLDFSGDGFLQVAVPSRKDGSDAALIQHSGQIRANGGTVVMQAATARDAARHAINLSGLVEARSVSGRSGAIILGGDVGGTVTVSGKLDASARTSNTPQAATSKRTPALARGGDITVTGNDVRLSGATLMANGTAGGGKIRVGGDYQGKGALQRASTTTVDAATTISANAAQTGNGGDVVIWSDQITHFAGRISATGGDQSGNGGQAEVSSHGVLDYTGTAILTAAHGSFGTLLLDPYNVTISNNSTSSSSTSSSSGSSGSLSTVTFTPTGNDSNINATTLTNQLTTANVTVTTGSSGSQAGTITLSAGTPLNWTSNATLTLQAASNIALNSAITAPSGGVTLSSGGQITALDTVAVARFTLALGNWVQNSATLPAFRAGDFRIQGGSFLRATGGNGSAGNPYRLVDIYGVQGIGSSTAYSTASYQLANDIDASGTPNWNSGAGFIPIGTGSSSTGSGSSFATTFGGTFDGQGHIIDRLTINSSGPYVGLFGSVQNATIQSLSLLNANVRSSYSGTGNSYTGGLAGYVTVSSGSSSSAATVSGVTISGVVIGGRGSGSSTGGLIGQNSSVITRSSATATVTGGTSFGNPVGASYTGGLIGLNSGTVSQSYATGSVTGGGSGGAELGGFTETGGLIGANSGTVSQAYATGSVTGGTASSNYIAAVYGTGTGGLIGSNSGTVSQVYATGSVTGGNSFGSGGDSTTGGLIGVNIGAVKQAYATGAVTGGSAIDSSSYTGGLIGNNSSAPSISSGGTVAEAYATGAVIGGRVSSSSSSSSISSFTGGLVGYNYSNIGNVITASFWDTQTTGQTLPAGNVAGLPGATGLTTAQFHDPTFFVPLAGGQGWNFQNTWAPPSASFYPQLYSINPVISVTADPKTRIYGQPNPALTGTVSGGPGIYVFGGSDANLPSATSLLTTSATQASNVGNYSITTVPGPVTLDRTSYRVAGIPSLLTITQAQLTITANSFSKTYGQFATLTYSPVGLVNGDTVRSVELASAGQPTTANVGAYPISAANAQGVGLSNYNVTYNNGTLRVDPAQLTIKADDQSKAFGDSFNFIGNEFTKVGLQNGETLTQADLNSVGQPSSAAAGPYTINISNARGGTANLNNYAPTYVTGTLTVGQQPVVPGGGTTTDGGTGQPQQSQAQLASTVADARITPNILTFVPNFTAPSLTLFDTINLFGPSDNITLGGGGPTLGVGQGSSGGQTLGSGEGSSTVASSTRTLAAINTASASLEAKLANCEKNNSGAVGGYSSCVSGSLDNFADTLDLQVQQLPPAFRSLPAVIRQAAQRVRAAPAVVAARGLTGAAARTAIIAESRAAVRVAVTAVRKAISLLRADEPAVARVQARQGQVIASALKAVDTSLSRAVGL